jgi:hypothetical protein
MVKAMALVCAAMLTFSVSGVGMMAGWFGSKAGTEPRQVRSSDPMTSDAAMRYRHCLHSSWRLALTVR